MLRDLKLSREPGSSAGSPGQARESNAVGRGKNEHCTTTMLRSLRNSACPPARNPTGRQACTDQRGDKRPRAPERDIHDSHAALLHGWHVRANDPEAQCPLQGGLFAQSTKLTHGCVTIRHFVRAATACGFALCRGLSGPTRGMVGKSSSLAFWALQASEVGYTYTEMVGRLGGSVSLLESGARGAVLLLMSI